MGTGSDIQETYCVVNYLVGFRMPDAAIGRGTVFTMETYASLLLGMGVKCNLIWDMLAGSTLWRWRVGDGSV